MPSYQIWVRIIISSTVGLVQVYLERDTAIPDLLAHSAGDVARAHMAGTGRRWLEGSRCG